MNLLKYLIALIGFLYPHVEAKAFRTSKGSFDHMHENLYLKKMPDESGQGYEMRYVPHVDGKPIFIPFDETFTPPNMLKLRPPRPFKIYPPTPKTGMKFEHKYKAKFEPDVKSLSKLKESYKYTTPIFKPDNLKFKNSGKQMQEDSDHPAVLDVVTRTVFDSNSLKEEQKLVIEPISKKPEIKKSIKTKPSEQEKIHSIEETYETGDHDMKETHAENLLKPYPGEVLKNKVKYPKEKKHEILKQPSDTQDFDIPSVVESLTKDEKYASEKQTVNAIKTHKVTDKKEILKQPIDTDDYDLPSVVESLTKDEKYDAEKHKANTLKTHKVAVINDGILMQPIDTDDYDLPIVIRSLTKDEKYDEKHEENVIKTHKVADKNGILMQPIDVDDHDLPSVIESLTKDKKHDAEKHTANVIKAHEVAKKEKLEAKLKKKVGKPVISSPDKDSLEKIKSGIKNQDISVESEENLSSSVKQNYYQQDYDSPVIIEALVKKNEGNLVKQTGMYDSPIVVEALVKKTDQIKDQTKHHKLEHDVKHHSAHLIKSSEASKGEVMSDDGYDSPVIVRVENNKKDNKYFTKMKHPKSNVLNGQDQAEPENLIRSTDQSSVEQGIIENLSLFDTDENDQFDVGSGLINERSSDSSRFSTSNVWPLLTSFHSQERNKFKRCKTPNEEPGNCMPIQMCPTPNLQLTLDDLLKKICAIDEVFIGICCPEFPAETLKVDWEKFKNVSNNDQESSEMKFEECGTMPEESHSWPWMALLISISTRKIFCGGVLIKAQYVLTAAHCTRKIPHNQIMIVLGPIEKDATNQEFEVVEIKRHAQYNPRTMQYDIALLKLSRKVARPAICLPHENNFAGMEALMLGWRGSFSESKIEEKLAVLSREECPKAGILCTEARTEDVMCNVDSGAPLILKHNEKYEVIGLLTWNRNDCNFPAHFTQVSHFTGWIENHSSS